MEVSESMALSSELWFVCFHVPRSPAMAGTATLEAWFRWIHVVGTLTNTSSPILAGTMVTSRFEARDLSIHTRLVRGGQPCQRQNWASNSQRFSFWAVFTRPRPELKPQASTDTRHLVARTPAPDWEPSLSFQHPGAQSYPTGPLQPRTTRVSAVGHRFTQCTTLE